MKIVNHEELKTILKITYMKKLPLFIWGATGIGKSYTVREVAKEIAREKGLEFSDDMRDINDPNKFVLIDMRISQLDASDLRGLPMHKDGKTVWIPPNMLPRAGQGIIFFDEINLAPPSIQATAYQLILDRKNGDYVLPEGYVIVSAGNRLEDRANVFELPAPLSNRFLHVELGVPDIDEWSRWASKSQLDARVITFLNYRNEYLFKFDMYEKSKAFPTPRSWEYASRLIDGIESLEGVETLSSTAVGEAVAIELTSFLKLKERVNFDEILNNPQSINALEKDLLYSVLSEVAYRYSKEPEKYIRKVLEISYVMDKPEFAIMLIKMCKNYDEDKWTAIAKKEKDLLVKVSQKYKDLIL